MHFEIGGSYFDVPVWKIAVMPPAGLSEIWMDFIQHSDSVFFFLQDLNQPRTTCILRDVTPGTYTIEVH